MLCVGFRKLKSTYGRENTICHHQGKGLTLLLTSSIRRKCCTSLVERFFNGIAVSPISALFPTLCSSITDNLVDKKKNRTEISYSKIRLVGFLFLTTSVCLLVSIWGLIFFRIMINMFTFWSTHDVIEQLFKVRLTAVAL